MMAALPNGTLSVHHFVSQVGDYVGFAAIVAVAIMVLLLFAHARETAELRRRAEYAEDELSLLHEQVEWLRDAQQSGGVSPGVVTPVGGAAGAGRMPGAEVSSATSMGTSGTVAPVPAPASAARRRAPVFGAPVGVGAPALSSATKLIPPTDEELRAVAAAAAAAAQPAHTGPAVIAAKAGGAGRSGAVVAPPTPPPATAAAGGNGKPPRRAGVAADPGAPGVGGRPAYPAAATSPRRNYGGGEERSGGRRVSRALIAAITLLVVAIVVVVVLVLGGSSNKNNHRTTANRASTTAKAKGKSKNATRGKARGAVVKINPQTVTVAVLNGTTTANLAAAVSDKLSNKGFQQGSRGNAANQTMATTIVGYLPADPGAKNDAYAVAVALGLKSTAVKPVSTASQSVACSGTPTNCPDQVIVTVGADLNSDAA
jgi:hypothetical protein